MWYSKKTSRLEHLSNFVTVLRSFAVTLDKLRFFQTSLRGPRDSGMPFKVFKIMRT